MNKKLVVILSGGMDSTVLTQLLHNEGYDVHALSFNYGQKHVKELQCAMATAAKLGIRHDIIDLSHLSSFLTSSLTDANTPVPEGHYADENMKSTVVPNRNMIMLSIAAGYAISIGAETVAYGAHAGDHAIYPDCRPIFRDVMSLAFRLCHFSEVELMVPFVSMNKSEICAIGDLIHVDFSNTWTCYKGEEKPCGVCGSCVERAEAFADNDLEDPLVC